MKTGRGGQIFEGHRNRCSICTFRLSSCRTVYAKILYYVLSIVFLSPFITICILANLVGNHRRRYLPFFLKIGMHRLEMART